MTKKTEGIIANEIVEKVYSFLTKGGQEIKFSHLATAEIANDSDWHRRRVGYMGYKSAVIVKISQKEWAIALGSTCGDYPANKYCCDLAAVEISTNQKTTEQLKAEIYRTLKSGNYFKNSLLIVMATGQLGTSGIGRFGDQAYNIIGLRLEEFVVERAEIDDRYFTMDLRPRVITQIKYKPEFVDFLVNACLKILSSS